MTSGQPSYVKLMALTGSPLRPADALLGCIRMPAPASLRMTTSTETGSVRCGSGVGVGAAEGAGVTLGAALPQAPSNRAAASTGARRPQVRLRMAERR